MVTIHFYRNAFNTKDRQICYCRTIYQNLSLKSKDMLEYQNIKIFFQKFTLQSSQNNVPWTYGYGRTKTKIELDQSNYTIKSDLKCATGIETSKFVKEGDLAN